MNALERIKLIAGDGSRSLAERHAAIRAIDTTAASIFAQRNAAPMERERREADAEAEAKTEKDRRFREDRLPQPELDTYEAMRRKDSLGAALFHRAHFALITEQREERRAVDAALSPEPPEAA